MSVRTLFLLGVVSMGAGGCKKAQGEQDKKEHAVPIRVEAAHKQLLVQEVFLSGEVLADVEVRVFSLVPERILKLKFEEGDRVKKGEILAVVKGGALWQSMRQTKAGLRAAKTQQQLAKIELDRTRKLYQTNTVAIAALQRAQAQYRVAQAQVAQMQASVGQMATNLSNVVIRAPISGVVGQRFLSQGDLAGPQLPLCTIIQTDQVRVKAMATEFDLVKLNKKQPARVTVPAFKNRVWRGEVDYIAPVIDRRTRSAWVTVLVNNPGGVLRPGMFADMRVETGRRPDVVMTLARAVQRRVDERGRVSYHVFVVKGNRAHIRAVKIGVRKEDLMEIADGLKDGEPVVVLGQSRLRDGALVRVMKRSAVATRDRPRARPEPREKADARPRPRRRAPTPPPRHRR